MVVHTDRHAVFGRQGKNLTLTVPVSFPEAALGATITVPTLDGPVTSEDPGRDQVGPDVPGQGPRRARRRAGSGDLLVTVEVAVPQQLSDAESAKPVEALASASDGDRLAPTWECEVMAVDLQQPSDSSRLRHLGGRRAGGVHPQTLRIYERKGLLDPARTGGGSRRYSERDIDRLRRIQDLTNAGLNLEGVRRVMELEAEVVRLQRRAGRGPSARPWRPSSAPTASTGATWCRSTARRRRWRPSR